MVYLRADQRRAQVVAAAARVIARVGLEAATTRLIAAEAGAPLGSLHYLFRDKRELMAAVYQNWYDTTVEQLTARNLEGAGLEQCIRTLTVGFFEDMLRDEDTMQLPYELFFWATRTRDTNDLADRIYREYRAFYAEKLRRSDPALTTETAQTVAQFIVHTCDGVLLHYFAERDAAAARASLELYSDLALRLARRPLEPVGAV